MTKLAYSVKEVCRLLGVSKGWLYLRWQRGDGPARFKAGGRTLVTAQALDSWLASLKSR